MRLAFKGTRVALIKTILAVTQMTTGSELRGSGGRDRDLPKEGFLDRAVLRHVQQTLHVAVPRRRRHRPRRHLLQPGGKKQKLFGRRRRRRDRWNQEPEDDRPTDLPRKRFQERRRLISFKFETKKIIPATWPASKK